MTNLRSIKKIALGSALAAPAALGLATGAHAAPVNQPFAISIGGSFLTDSNASKNTSSTGLHVGLDYDLAKDTGYGTPSVDFDYDNNNGHGNYLDTYGLFLADRYALTKDKTGAIPYVGAGIGLAFIDGRATTTQNSGYPDYNITHGHITRTATNFAGKILAGVAFNQAFIEVSYAINGSVSHVNDDLIDVSIGTHF